MGNLSLADKILLARDLLTPENWINCRSASNFPVEIHLNSDLEEPDFDEVVYFSARGAMEYYTNPEARKLVNDIDTEVRAFSYRSIIKEDISTEMVDAQICADDGYAAMSGITQPTMTDYLAAWAKRPASIRTPSEQSGYLLGMVGLTKQYDSQYLTKLDDVKAKFTQAAEIAQALKL